MKTKIKLTLLTLIAILFVACDPPGNVHHYRADFSFPNTTHTVDVYASLTVQYYGSTVIYYNTVPFVPMYAGQDYEFSVELPGVDLNQLQYLFCHVQQGYIVNNEIYNLFRVRVFEDGIEIYSSNNFDYTNNAFNEVVISQ